MSIFRSLLQHDLPRVDGGHRTIGQRLPGKFCSEEELVFGRRSAWSSCISGMGSIMTLHEDIETPVRKTLASPMVPTSGKPKGLKRLLNVSEVGVLVPLVVLIAVFQLMNSAFLSQADIDGILVGISYVGVIAVGQAFLMVTGQFDLSVGSTAGLAAVSAGWFMTNGVPVAVSLILALVVGMVVGAVNALSVVKLGIPAFIATLGMLWIAEGVTLMIGGGGTIFPLPSIIGKIGTAKLLHLSYSFWLFVILVVAGEFILRKTTFGRAAYASGGNPEVARLAGINVSLVRTVAFIATGALAAVAGILIMASVASADSQIGNGYELTVIAGVVVGGVSLFGGVGSVIGAALGVTLLQVVQSGLVVVGMSANWQTVAVGTIMIVAVGVDVLRRRMRAS